MKAQIGLVGIMAAMVVCLPWATAAADSEPLYVKNLSPVSALYGLPAQRSAQSQRSGTVILSLHNTIANHYVLEDSAAERANIDGETVRIAFELRYGLADNWDVQVELPWLEHSGGRLDSAIENWHGLWGMPDGGRPDVGRDILDMAYRGPKTQLSVNDKASGVGDISVALNHSFYRGENATASVVFGYKFASGDDSDLLGSGADDIYLALRYSGVASASSALQWHGQVGYTSAGESEILDDSQNTNLWFAGVSVDWRVAPGFALFAQLDTHRATADSALALLGGDAFLGTVGGRWSPGTNWSLDFSITEDLQVDTAPDITFQASLRYSR